MRIVFHPEHNFSTLEDCVVLVRHGVDINVLSHDLDQPLTVEASTDVLALADELASLSGVFPRKLVLYHSRKKRSSETAAILKGRLLEHKLSVEMRPAMGVREIYQGEFIIRDYIRGSAYQPLLDAWAAWQEKLNAGELLYRFGDPCRNLDGSLQYPNLVGWFTKLGEHQADFSLRLYLFMVDLFNINNTYLPVVVGHQASCSRIQRAYSAMHSLNSSEAFRPGEFVKVLEKRGTRMPIESACGVIVRRPDISLGLTVLKKEIDFLRDIIV